MDVSNRPVVIEAAVTPLRKGEPIKPAPVTIAEGKECLAAGAGIIHHHHDFRLSREAAIAEMIEISGGLLADYPDALVYPDYLRGTQIWEKKRASAADAGRRRAQHARGRSGPHRLRADGRTGPARGLGDGRRDLCRG